MFGWEFPPHNSGGLGTACLGLSRALVNQGINLTIVLPRKLDNYSDSFRFVFPEDKLSPDQLILVNSLLYPYVTPDIYDIIINGTKHHINYGGNLFEEVKRYALSARMIAANEDFDVIHAHDWLAFGAGLEAKNVSNKKLVVHVHATEFDRTGGNGVNQDVYNIEREGMHRADSIIAVSNFTKNIVVKNYGVPAEKIHVIHNSVSHEDYAPLDGNENSQKDVLAFKKLGYKLVVFVGRITLQKGLDYFLNAAKIVSEHVNNALFIIVGSGDMEKQIILQAARLGISDKVIFAGFLRGAQLSKIYKSADLFIMPSVSEPFGLTALEAILHGAPVLISKQSGVAEVLSNALKVDFWDVDEMANQAIAALQHESMNNCLKNYGKEEVKRYSWDIAARKCVSLYQNIT